MTDTRELLELSGDGLRFYEVTEHTEQQRLNAARQAIEGLIGVFDSGVPKTVAWLASKADARTMRPHVEPPEYCGCESEGWWCEAGDGDDARLFYAFEDSDIYFEGAETRAHDEDGDAQR